jgi:hypothetical protein
MEWTNQSKIAVLLRLPWTIDSTMEEGERVLRVRELPSVVVSGTDERELEREFWESLRESLAAYLHFGDPIPLPTGVRMLPWDPGYSARGSSSAVLTLRVTPMGTAQVRGENAETTQLAQAG